MRDMTLSAATSTRTTLSWFLCADSIRSWKSCDAERRFALVAAELLRMVASWPWLVAESTRPRGLRLRQRLTHIRVGGGRVARDEGRSPLPEQRRGGGDHGRRRRWGDAGIDLEVRLDPVSRGQADRLDAADPHAPQHHGVAHAQSAHRTKPRRVDRLGLPQMRAREPQRSGHHHREGGDHHHADGELVLALHAGRPSMNCRTTGSPVCWISATGPTWRIRPSYNMAIRAPTA